MLGKVITNDQNCVSLTTPINYTYGVSSTVPNVVGMTRAAAVTALINPGLSVGYQMLTSRGYRVYNGR